VKARKTKASLGGSKRQFAPLLKTTRHLFLGEEGMRILYGDAPQLADQDGGGVCPALDSKILAELMKHRKPSRYPVEAFPAMVRGYLCEIAEISRVPVPLVAASVLGVGSACLMDRVRAKVRRDMATPANLYLLPFARSGTGKTTALQQVRKPLETCANDALLAWEREELPMLKAAKAEADASVKRYTQALCEGNTSEAVKQAFLNAQVDIPLLEAQMDAPCWVTEEATTEFVEAKANRMRGRLSTMSDDARGCLDILCGKYTRGQTNEALYLKGFSLAAHRAGRLGRGSIQIDEMCISVLWMIQPDKINTLFKNPAFTEGGLLPRFLVEHVDCDPSKWREDECAPSSQAGWTDMVRRLWTTYRMAPEWREVPVSRSQANLFPLWARKNRRAIYALNRLRSCSAGMALPSK
jgi:hypothetical protein